MTKRRVVITGMGVVSPFGVGADKLWDGVVNGKSAISTIENMGDMTGHTVLIGGEIKESAFNPVDYFEPKEAKRLDKAPRKEWMVEGTRRREPHHLHQRKGE